MRSSGSAMTSPASPIRGATERILVGQARSAGRRAVDAAAGTCARYPPWGVVAFIAPDGRSVHTGLTAAVTFDVFHGTWDYTGTHERSSESRRCAARGHRGPAGGDCPRRGRVGGRHSCGTGPVGG